MVVGPQLTRMVYYSLVGKAVNLSTYKSGKIIATSHDLTPNGGLAREIPLFQGNLGWRNIIVWPDK